VIASGQPWLLGHRPGPRVRLRLLCFPYAGGSASIYQGWSAGLPSDVDVCAIQLPGHQTRLAEPPFTDLAPMLGAIAEALLPYSDLPWALFGHSFGGLVAFEFARWLRRNGSPPRHLFIAGALPPEVLARRPSAPASDSDLVASLQRRNGLPAAVLGDAELLELVLPALRADVTVLENYRYQPESPLDVPLSVFGGAKETESTPTVLSAWRSHTSNAFRHRILPGGHFFIDSERAALLASITEDLRAQGLIGPEQNGSPHPRST
jgi:surfactin synthase thioesterase subunit